MGRAKGNRSRRENQLLQISEQLEVTAIHLREISVMLRDLIALEAIYPQKEEKVEQAIKSTRAASDGNPGA